MNQITKWINAAGELVSGSDGRFDPAWITFKPCTVIVDRRKVLALMGSYTDPAGADRAIACDIDTEADPEWFITEALRRDYAALHAEGKLP